MESILQVENLKKYFPLKRNPLARASAFVYAVDGVSFSVERGKTLGLVGESGCGKTTLALSILRLIEPTSGDVFFQGENLLRLSDKEMRRRRKDIQIIFQDPYSSLNPRMTIKDIVAEPLRIHEIGTPKERKEMVLRVINRVGLQSTDMARYPREFSGGQRQRIAIARAVISQAKLIIGDEPVSALDVSIRAQVINLLQDLQQELDLSFIIISHDLSVIKRICAYVAVMYLGKIVEIGSNSETYGSPAHPYTMALLSAVPIPNPNHQKKRIILDGDVPTPINPPSGCYFHPRCSFAKEVCKYNIPSLVSLTNDHKVACHLYSV